MISWEGNLTGLNWPGKFCFHSINIIPGETGFHLRNLTTLRMLYVMKPKVAMQRLLAENRDGLPVSTVTTILAEAPDMWVRKYSHV